MLPGVCLITVKKFATSAALICALPSASVVSNPF